MQLIANTEFSWAHGGVRVEHFAKGQEIETEDADLIEVATSEGWATQADAPKKAGKQKAKD